MAARSSGAEAECSAIERVMAVLGRAWAGAVVQAMLDGHERYSELARSVPGVADSVLTTRLKELCDRGLAERVVDPGPPVAVHYRLTRAGRDIAPVLRAVQRYAHQHPEVLAGG